MKPVLCLAIIVKNEARTIVKTLESCLRHVDYFAIMDTGSTDNSVDIVSEWLRFNKVKGSIFQDSFVDYATARNRVLELAVQAYEFEFSISLSADETLVGGAELRAYLEARTAAEGAGAYCIMMRSGPRQWPFPRILRTGGGWKFMNTAGKRHEQPYGPKGEIEGPLVPGVFVVHEESNLQRKLKRLRFKDLPDLTAVVDDETLSLENRAEAMFQLAETLFVLGHNEPLGDDGQPERGGAWLSHKFASMALYNRYAELAEIEGSKVYDRQKAMYARTMYCYVAETFGLFEPAELVKRLQAIAAVAFVPEAHWLLAKNAAKVDVRKAIPLAMRSAKIARYVYERPVHGAVDVNLEWQSLLLASDCCRIIKDKKLQLSFAKQAIAAGAPLDVVGDLAG
ncbi:MAG: glycosyltransferase [Gemmatimonadota bacterium]